MVRYNSDWFPNRDNSDAAPILREDRDIPGDTLTPEPPVLFQRQEDDEDEE